MSPSVNQTRLADMVGTSRDSIAKYETGKNRVPDDVLNAIVKVSGFPLSWFLDGLDTNPPMNFTDRVEILENKPVIRTVSLPYWGSVPCGDWEKPIGDPATETVSAEVEGIPGEKIIVKAIGDSMHPIIRHGQKVAVRLGSTPIDGVIHLCKNQDHELTLKIYRLRDGKPCLESANSNYPSVTAEQITILGRVVHIEQTDPEGIRV